MRTLDESIALLEEWRKMDVHHRVYSFDSAMWRNDLGCEDGFLARAMDRKSGKVSQSSDTAESALSNLCDALGLGGVDGN